MITTSPLPPPSRATTPVTWPGGKSAVRVVVVTVVAVVAVAVVAVVAVVGVVEVAVGRLVVVAVSSSLEHALVSNTAVTIVAAMVPALMTRRPSLAREDGLGPSRLAGRRQQRDPQPNRGRDHHVVAQAATYRHLLAAAATR